MFRKKQKTRARGERQDERGLRRPDEKTTLASILLSMRAITPAQLEAAKAAREAHESSHAEMMLASTLRTMGFCNSDDVSMALKIQSKMLNGDRASVALDLMEARIDRYRAGEEQLHQEIERRRARLREERDTTVVIPFSPVTAKAL
jgi:hypothetical protein